MQDTFSLSLLSFWVLEVHNRLYNIVILLPQLSLQTFKIEITSDFSDKLNQMKFLRCVQGLHDLFSIFNSIA